MLLYIRTHMHIKRSEFPIHCSGRNSGLQCPKLHGKQFRRISSPCMICHISISISEDTSVDIDLPFEAEKSRPRKKIPDREEEWLVDHFQQQRCRHIIPDLRSLYMENSLFHRKWPKTDMKLKIR